MAGHPRQPRGAVFTGNTAPSLTDRVLDRLWEAESSEPDIHSRSDYRQASICVSLAGKGERQPFVTYSYRIYGSHLDDVWPKIMANRKAKLGKEFANWFDQAGNRKPDIPEKPSTHVDKSTTNSRAEKFCIPRLPSEPEARKLLRILPVEKAA